MASSASTSKDNNDNGRITLRVGEKTFYTTKNTLIGESDYFKACLSSRWEDADKDGSYFVDGDPVIFEHILKYLRTGQPSLFFDSSTQTHDIAQYATLLGNAQYYQIAKLERYVLEKKYENVIKVKFKFDVIDESTFLTGAGIVMDAPGVMKTEFIAIPYIKPGLCAYMMTGDLAFTDPQSYKIICRTQGAEFDPDAFHE